MRPQANIDASPSPSGFTCEVTRKWSLFWPLQPCRDGVQLGVNLTCDWIQRCHGVDPFTFPPNLAGTVLSAATLIWSRASS